MNRIAALVVEHSKWVLVVFGLLAAFSAALIPLVRINYNLADYVPPEAPSTRAIEVMAEEFDDAVPNVRVYVPDVSVVEALAVKQRIADLPDVELVMWLDDFIDLKEPLEIANSDLVSGFYAGGGALFQVAVGLDNAPTTLISLQEIATEQGAVEGQLVDIALAQRSASSEMNTIMLFMLPLGVAMLMFATRSWLDPLILLATVGVAIVMNLGSNVVLGQISFLTAAVTSVLQLAVSMDYGIFLLHARARHRTAGLDREESLRSAVKESSKAIVASSSTTILGFLALTFMSFRLGPDLGVVLAKGVAFSLLCVLVLMPAIIHVLDRAIVRTSHRKLLPDFGGLGRVVGRGMPGLLVIGAVLPVCFMAQGMNDFRYGTSAYPEQSREHADRAFIQAEFGRALPMALLVPKGDWGREFELVEVLTGLEEVTAVSSYQTQVGRLLPSEVLPADQLGQLLGPNYSRIVLSVDTDKEGAQAFEVVDRVRGIAEQYYGRDYHLTGESVVTSDMRTVITADGIVVNGLAIVGVGFVLLLSFRSLVIPLILLLTIEGSIWINLSVPYFTGTHLTYIGYLIVSTVQLGATVDYAILFTQHYLGNRSALGRREAVAATVSQTFGTLVTPAMILTAAGVILSVVSSLEVVSQLGTVLGRGALLSFVMVNTFLPALLFTFDRLIEATTWRTHFLRSQS